MNKKFFVASLVFFLLATASFYFSNNRNVGAAFNSDAMYIPVLLNDLFHQGGVIGDWYLTPSPYFFPDMMIFIPGFLITKDAYLQVVIYGLVQVSLFYWALLCLFKALDRVKYELEAATLVLIYLTASLMMGRTFQYIFISAHHFSILIIALVVLKIIIGDGQNRNIFAMLLVFALSALTAFSDSLFIIQFAIPSFVAAIIIGLTSNKWIYLRGSLACIIGSASGYVAYPRVVVNATRYSADIGFNKLENLLWNFNALSKMDRVNLLMLTIILIVLGVGIFYRKNEFYKVKPKIQYTILVAAIGLIMNSVVVLLTQNIDATDRYLIPLSLTIVSCIALVLSSFITSKKIIYGTFVLLSCLNLGYVCYLGWANKGFGRYNANEMGCLESAIRLNGLSYGVSEYWDAKKVQSLTGFRVKIGQYTYSGDKQRWITSEQYFKNDPTFVIVSSSSVPPHKINIEQILKLNGKPVDVIKCYGNDILIYDKPVLLN